MNLLQFASHLKTAVLTITHEHHGLRRACEVIVKEAKHEIGVYQGAAGPFAKWQPLADSTLNGFGGRPGKSADTPLLETGALRDSIAYEVENHTAHVGSPLDTAIYQELGTRTIPPRSFLGGAAVRKGHEASRAAGFQVASTIAGHRITSE